MPHFNEGDWKNARDKASSADSKAIIDALHALATNIELSMASVETKLDEVVEAIQLAGS